MDSAFLNLIRGNRVTAYMGLKLGDGVPPKYGPSYQYIEIPVKCFRKDDGTELDKANPNQHLEVIPNCTIKVRGSQAVMVHYNPALQAVGSMAGSHIVWPGTDEQCPSFYVSFRKGITVAELEWAIRLSLLA
jgi:hypothetical protein